MKYKITDIRVEWDRVRIILEEVAEEVVKDSFAETIALDTLRSMSVDDLKATIKDWIRKRRELLKKVEEERKEAERIAKDFEGLKGEEIEVS